MLWNTSRWMRSQPALIKSFVDELGLLCEADELHFSVDRKDIYSLTILEPDCQIDIPFDELFQHEDVDEIAGLTLCGGVLSFFMDWRCESIEVVIIVDGARPPSCYKTPELAFLREVYRSKKGKGLKLKNGEQSLSVDGKWPHDPYAILKDLVGFVAFGNAEAVVNDFVSIAANLHYPIRVGGKVFHWMDYMQLFGNGTPGGNWLLSEKKKLEEELPLLKFRPAVDRPLVQFSEN